MGSRKQRPSGPELLVSSSSGPDIPFSSGEMVAGDGGDGGSVDLVTGDPNLAPWR